MNKKKTFKLEEIQNRAIILMALIFLVLLFSCWLSSDKCISWWPLNRWQSSAQVAGQIIIAPISNQEYETQVKNLVKDLLVPENLANQETLGIIKNKLLNIRVPTTYQAVHLDLVIILNKLENNTEGSEQEFFAVLERYSWLR